MVVSLFCLLAALAADEGPFREEAVRPCRIEVSARDWEDLRLDECGSEKYRRCLFAWGNEVRTDVEVRRRGEASRGLVTPKPNLMLRFPKDRLFHGLRHLGLDGLEADATQMAERLCYEVYEAAGVPSPRMAHVWVDLRLGDGAVGPLGLYTVEEPVDRWFLARRFGDRGGELYRLRQCFEDPFAPRDGGLVPFPFEPEGDAGGSIAGLAACLRGGASRAEMERRIDIERWTSYLAVEAVTGQADGFLAKWREDPHWHNNTWLYASPRDGRLVPIAWDRDAAFLTNPAEDVRARLGWTRISAWFEADPEARASYLERCRALVEGPCAPDRLIGRSEEIRRAIRPSIERDRNRTFTIEEVEKAFDAMKVYVVERAARVKACVPGIGDKDR